MRLLALCLLALAQLEGCGGGGAATTSSGPGPQIDVHPSRNVTDDVVESRGAEITRDHAIRIGAAAIQWRRAHGGQCPTTTNVIEAYTFTAGTEKDASGSMLVLECNGTELRVLSGGSVIHSERDEPVPIDATSNLTPAITARIKACYDLASRQGSSSGAIHGELVIAKDGMIKQVIVDSKRSTVDSPELLRCVQTKLKNVSSDIDTHGKETRVAF